MEYIERFFGCRPKQKDGTYVEPQVGKSDDKLQAELQGLSRIIESGYPEQHTIANVMGGMVREDLAVREAGYKAREPRYQTDLDIGIISKGGRKTTIHLRENGLAITFPFDTFSPDDVYQALIKTYPDYELFTEPPHYFPEKWAEQEFKGLRKPVEPFAGQPETRALWLLVRDWNMSSALFTNITPEGKIETHIIDNRSLNVMAGPEIRSYWVEKAIDGSEDTWFPQTVDSIPRGLPEYQQMQGRIGTFIGNLLGEDKVRTISIHPNGWDTIMTPAEARKQPGFHLVKKETWIRQLNASEVETSEHNTVDRPNWESGKYIFNIGDNEFGLFHERSGGYLLPYQFMRVQHYPQGLPGAEIQSEIERMRSV